jgi:hypothetical protein
MMFVDASGYPVNTAGAFHGSILIPSLQQQPGFVQLFAVQSVADPVVVAADATAAARPQVPAVQDKEDEHDDDALAVVNLPIPASVKWTLEKLKQEVLVSTPTVLQFVIKRGVIPENKECPKCASDMRIVKDKRLPEGVKYRCKKKGAA